MTWFFDSVLCMHAHLCNNLGVLFLWFVKSLGSTAHTMIGICSFVSFVDAAHLYIFPRHKAQNIMMMSQHLLKPSRQDVRIRPGACSITLGRWLVFSIQLSNKPAERRLQNQIKYWTSLWIKASSMDCGRDTGLSKVQLTHKRAL